MDKKIEMWVNVIKDKGTPCRWTGVLHSTYKEAKNEMITEHQQIVATLRIKWVEVSTKIDDFCGGTIVTGSSTPGRKRG